jgi:hypothetical protein
MLRAGFVRSFVLLLASTGKRDSLSSVAARLNIAYRDAAEGPDD